MGIREKGQEPTSLCTSTLCYVLYMQAENFLIQYFPYLCIDCTAREAKDLLYKYQKVTTA